MRILNRQRITRRARRLSPRDRRARRVTAAAIALYVSAATGLGSMVACAALGLGPEASTVLAFVSMGPGVLAAITLKNWGA